MEKVLGIIRHILTAGGGALVALGLLSEGDLSTISGLILTLVGTVWSVVIKNKK